MQDRSDSETESDSSLRLRVRDSKMINKKRSTVEMGEKEDHLDKRVKMKDLETIVGSEGIDTHNPKSPKTMNAMSQVTGKHSALDSDDVVQVKIKARSTNYTSNPLDFNLKVPDIKSFAPDHTAFTDTSNNLAFSQNNEKKTENLRFKSQYVEDVSSSINKIQDHYNSKDNSECASSIGPLEEKKDPLTIWKEMKQNGFLSSTSHGGIPIPKKIQKKSREIKKNDLIKKKIEISKKEQVDKFMKMVAPTGLLKELNPGIITHVRNKKQVRSIIEGIVRSEKLENDKKNGSKEINVSKHNPDNVINNKNNFINLEEINGDAADSSMVNRQVNDTSGNEMQMIVKSLGNISSISMGKNLSCVFSLSLRAATVASHWLELLHKDINGRLAALHRSKKRVHAVIHTELPCLMSKEFSCDQENVALVNQRFSSSCSKQVIVDMHQARWRMLFDQVDKTLSEEEKQLDCWLDQVKGMQLHCANGLQAHHIVKPHWSKPIGLSENNTSLKKFDDSEMELAVRAAAAAIYSTCNFLLSKNMPCSS